MRGFAIAALALVGLLFAWTPLAERADLALLDAEFSFLRNFNPRTSPDDIIVVGIDEATFRAIPEPLGMWHASLGRVLAKVASAKPRAIGIDLVLPDRSWDDIRPGLDRALMVGLVAARDNGPLVTSLSIDPRTRSAKTIFAPYVAVLREERLGIGLFGRDPDGVVRRFSLAIPTQDGNFPTFAGRICRALSKACRDGLIDYAFGPPFRYVPFHEVLSSTDATYLGKLFRERIVLIGETQRFADRVTVPLNLAGWEAGGRDTPGVVAHAAALRSALHGNPPADAAKPVALLLVTAAALLVLMREWRLSLLTAILAGAALLALATAALNSGLAIEIAPALFTLLAAWMSRTAFEARTERRERLRLREGFAGYVSPAVLRGILKGEIVAGHVGEKRDLAFVFADLRGSTAMTAGTTPEEALKLLNRFHEVLATAIHRHEGMLDNIRGDGVMAVFGAPKALASPSASAWAALTEMFRGLERLNAELGKEGKPPLTMVAGMAFGEAVVGHLGAKDRFNYTAVGDAANLAARLQEEAKRRGMRALVSGNAREKLGDVPLESLGEVAVEGLGAIAAFGWR